MALKPVCELFALFVKIHIVAVAGAEIFDLAALSFKFLSTGNQGVLKTLSVGILELLSQLFRLWKEFHGQAAAAQRRTNSQIVAQPISIKIGDKKFRWGPMALQKPEFFHRREQAIKAQ